MFKRFSGRVLAGILTAAMLLTSAPASVMADNVSSGTENAESTASSEETVSQDGSGNTAESDSSSANAESVTSSAAENGAESENTAAVDSSAAADSSAETESSAGSEETAAAESSADTYDVFLKDLSVLQEYADAYAKANSGKSANALIINYIRNGVERYTTDSWKIMAGSDNTGFVNYVAEQDKANNTTASGLRNLGIFHLTKNEWTSSEEYDFSHMFGMMDIASYNGDVDSTTADMGGWAGDLVDLVTYVHKHCDSVSSYSESNIDDFADLIEKNYLHVDADGEDSFGDLDIRGDLDGYYLMKTIAGGGSLSDAVGNYFTEDLTEANRAAFFLNHKFSGKTTKADIRAAMLQSYEANQGCQLLEADRSLNSLSELETLRKGCVYAFADYLYDCAKDLLNPGDTPVTPVDPDDPGSHESNSYYTVFSSSASTLAPGVTQNIKYATTADNKQIVYYLATADLSNKDVHIYANYGDNDGSQASSGLMRRVSDQMAAAQTKHSNPDDKDNYIANYNTIAGVNADFYNMSTGVPSGVLIMGGNVYNDSYANVFFGITKDGTPVIDSGSNRDQYDLQEAVGAGAVLVKDGKMAVSTSNSYYNNRASRTAVGITADNKVVLMVLDGRQEPFSAGGSAEEVAQIMLDAGCVSAAMFDGGGSSTFVAKEEGADSCSVVNRPSDGYERSVSSSLMIVSTAETSNEFDHAVISSDKDYLTVGAKLPLTVSGVSSSGNTAALPDGLTLKVSDDSIGSLDSDHVFTAAKTGDVEIQAIYNGAVVGTKTLHVVIPDSLGFEKSKIQAVYGVAVPLPVEGYYKGNPVEICADTVTLSLDPSKAGSIENLSFTGDESSGVRVVNVTAALQADATITATAQISLYKNGEAVFDFDNATETMDDGSFAWNRDVSNSSSVTTDDDGTVYSVKDPMQPMDISYVFALDMRGIKIPDKLKPLISLLPGGDSDSATAWQFMLQLAERISVKSSVTFELTIDDNLDIDYSNLVLSNDYFTLTSSSYDESTHKLTVVFNWIDQSAAIDPSTANPICILSGIKAKPKSDAAWDSNHQLKITNTGSFGYDIYLRSSTLYGILSSTSLQEQYGVYPFDNKDIIINGQTEKGGHFGTKYIDFEDKFTLDNTDREGWQQLDGKWYYFENNQYVTGIKEVPGQDDAANKYYYSFGSDGVSNGKVSGLFEMNGDLYFAKNGVLQGGWQSVSQEGTVNYYFFNTWSHKALDGEQTIGGYHYTFKNHILVRGDLVTRSDGNLWYMWAGSWASQRWMTIDGKKYYFRSSYNAAKGPYSFNINNKNVFYAFDENGVWQEDANGLWNYGSDTYLVKDGIIEEYPGLVKIDGYYYYFDYIQPYKAVKSRTYWISKTNGLLLEKSYTFDANGRIVFSGWLTDGDGTTWCDENGNRPYVSTWATIDGKTYYFDENGYIIKGLSSEITGQDGTTKGQYVFDSSTGEFLSAQNGLYTSGDDTYWTKEGMVVPYAGLQKVTGTNGEVSYYYFGEENKAVKNLPESGPDQWIPVEKTNGLLPSWGYHFDENGVILHNSDTSLNGFATVDGVKMYFINGVPAPMGMITVDGDTYYVTSKGVVMTGRSYYCSLLRTEAEQAAFPVITTAYKEGTYTFDSEGRMVQPEAPKNGIYEEDGSFYYYVNGARTYGGVMKLDADHAYYINASGEKAALTAGDYYAATSGEIVHAASGTGTRKYWISKTNGLVTEKSYTFDEKGLMLDVPDTSKNGLYEESGSCWYYENGMRTYGGVMKLDADHAYYINASGEKVTLTAGYYYAATSGEIVRAAAGAGTRKYWISKTNDLLAEKSYTFDETGRITDAVEKKAETVNGIVEEDGSYYYYQKGLRTYGGVMKLENATYTAADGTQAALEDGYYYAATSGEIVHAAAGAGTRKYWISKTNGLLKEKSYTFDEKGRILDADDGK